MIEDIERQRGSLREPVEEFIFKTLDGDVSLGELFGEKRDLLVIHNMGRGCTYCTMWADGLNGLLPHLADRAAVVLASPNDPETQREFAASRGWGFRMVSTQGSTFAKSMSFEPQPGQYWPGISAFYKQDDGSIIRTGKAVFGPGDEFNAAWHMFALLHDGANRWGPKYEY